MKNITLFALTITLLLAACTLQSTTVTLTVQAAASLTEAFQELALLFEAAHPGVKVQFNFGGSQQLAQQIISGAPADVFASANQKQMDTVISAGRIDPAASRNIAQNRLAVIVPRANPARLTALTDLARPGLKLVFAAREVPAGQYSLDFLTKASADPAYGAGYKDAVLQNVVSYETNVKAVVTKVALGEADAGIVYTTDVSGSSADKITLISIPDKLNVVAVYPMAAIKDSPNRSTAQAFVAFVLSSQGQAVLQKYGFLPPP